MGAVHPRAGGEHKNARWEAPCSGGSSPRRRGTQRRPIIQDRRCRFIPAQAGNTLATRAFITAAPVHPRAGGEHDTGRWR
ncbi:Hypothetical protein GbCGDNIH2_7191 [Granulibacter bethesdensis]|nr:Hypothetical protein GbCGDNIH2_7191 [Granulibacter bethesdensis]